MPRFRFTVRRMMVAVAIVGFLTWGAIMSPRVTRFSSRARREAMTADELKARYWKRLEAELGLMLKHGGLPDEADRDETDLRLRQSEWHRALAQKYERAALSPWLPVAPDPPAPE